MKCANCGSINIELIFNECGQGFYQCKDCKAIHIEDNLEK